MKILHVVGNRPQFIKLARLYPILTRRMGPGYILHTGQHYEHSMSGIFFSELDIPLPDRSLDIHGLGHAEMISRMLTGIDRVLATENPEAVLVYGDTNSTLAGALAARKRNIPLIHVEAGIRTGDGRMPEEFNRILTDRMSDLNFCSTYLGYENLQKEGFQSFINNTKIFNSGDLLLDNVSHYRAAAQARTLKFLPFDFEESFLLATIHRAEHTGAAGDLLPILQAMNEIHQVIPLFVPLHPKTKKLIEENHLPVDFYTHPPLGYLDMLALTLRCRGVLTDSGGLSREAFFLRKPTLVIMRHPFWPEILHHGACRQTQPEKKEIVLQWQKLMEEDKPFEVDIFGDGRAAEKITEAIGQSLL